MIYSPEKSLEEVDALNCMIWADAVLWGGHFKVHKDMAEVLLMLQVLLANYSSACGFSLFGITFNMTFLEWLMRLIVRYC